MKNDLEKFHGQQGTPDRLLQGQAINLELVDESSEKSALYGCNCHSNRNQRGQGISRDFAHSSRT